MTAVASALACRDILALVFSHLDPSQKDWEECDERSHSRQACRKALASSAVTCRSLSDHALDVLWRELHQEKPRSLMRYQLR